MAGLEIGCSGFNYPHWRGAFYPEGIPQTKWLEFYCTVFSSVELNVTFYRLPKPETFDGWRRQTPAGFAFSLKGSRFITHVKRLREPAEPLARFFDGALHLEEKLLAVLWQFPPAFSLNLERLRTFLQLLAQYPVRNTLEFRNESWLVPEVVDLCREHNVGLCMADWPDFIHKPPLTADFVYIRRHGHGGDYAGRYSREELEQDALRIRGHLGEGRDVFIYFNNDVRGFAPQNAQELMGMVK